MIIKKNQYGIKGVFSREYFKKGDIITELKGKVSSEPNKFTYQISKGLHLQPENNFKYVNHACRPNIIVEGYRLMACKDIDPGDELVFNYNQTEEVLANPFICNCCGKWIKGKKFVSQQENAKAGK